MPKKDPTSYQRKQRDAMQENIESFVNYYGQEHCFEFTVTARQLTPAEFSKCWNSCLTNFLRVHMPERIGVVEPHKSGFCHAHNLVALPFASPHFDHDALRRSREAFINKDFVTSRREWAKVRESMSPEHERLWDLLQKELPKYGLGKQIGFAPVREGARAIACYFGKYLAKGIANRPDDWTRVRLVRYSGTNGTDVAPWKCATPLRSSMCIEEQNRRDKVRAVAEEAGIQTPEEMAEVFGSRWYFHARELIDRVQVPVYRSLLHADADGVPVDLPTEGMRWTRLAEGTDGEQLCAVFPDWAYSPHTPKVTREGARNPFEVAYVLLSWAARSRAQAVHYYLSIKRRAAHRQVSPEGFRTRNMQPDEALTRV